MDRVLDVEVLSDVIAPFYLGLLVLFGSCARANQRADSDVDFGALHRTGRRLAHRELGALHVGLSRLCNAHADVVDLSTFDAVFRYEVVSHGRPVFEAEPGIWTKFVARALIDHDDLGAALRDCITAVGRAAREAAT